MARRYSPTDTDHRLIKWLGHPAVHASPAGVDMRPGNLANIQVCGCATISHEGIVTHVVPIEQVVFVDQDGFLFRDDETLGPWRVTSCCAAFAKGTDDSVVCRGCYVDVDEEGPANPFPGFLG